jgi:hypothetical protein
VKQEIVVSKASQVVNQESVVSKAVPAVEGTWSDADAKGALDIVLLAITVFFLFLVDKNIANPYLSSVDQSSTNPTYPLSTPKPLSLHIKPHNTYYLTVRRAPLRLARALGTPW